MWEFCVSGEVEDAAAGEEAAGVAGSGFACNSFSLGSGDLASDLDWAKMAEIVPGASAATAACTRDDDADW